MNKRTVQLLDQHFDTAFAASDGIKKLRELILTLAMQGKLVPQDTKDQPARVLLKEIEAEKRRLVKAKKIKVPKPLSEIKPEEVPYELPKGWAWVRLNQAFDVRDGTHDTPKYVDIGYPLITSKNLYTGQLSFEYVKYISEEDHLKINERSKVDNGDILFAMIGSIGNPVIVECDVDFSIKNVALFKFYNTGKPINRYLHYFLLSAQENMKATSSGAVQSFVSLGFLRNYLFPLPPLPEQVRIVTKIDQLMALCDALEKLRDEHKQKHLAVHTAALAHLLEAQDHEAFINAWQFIPQHFSELYSVKENVTELRKAILQLAVTGKLVAQNPKDQPASELLKKIKAEKHRLVKKGKVKKPKPLPPINPEEMTYELPQGWEWVRLGDASLSSDSGWSPQCLPAQRSDGQWGVLKVSAVSWGKFNPNENKALPLDKDPRPECEVKAGDFLLSRANTDELVARSVIVDKTTSKLMMSDKIVRFSLSQHINKHYTNVANGTDFARAYYITNASGTSSSMKNVTRQVMSELPIPLPPLSEQDRIVAKINQLMVLCDALEQQIYAATGKHTELLNAVMAQV